MGPLDPGHFGGPKGYELNQSLQARNFIAAKSVELRAFADKACHGDMRNLELEVVFLGRETIGKPVFLVSEDEEPSKFCASSWRN